MAKANQKDNVVSISDNPKEKCQNAYPLFVKMVEASKQHDKKKANQLGSEIGSEFELILESLDGHYKVTGKTIKPVMLQFVERLVDVCSESILDVNRRDDWFVQQLAKVSSDEGGFTTKPDSGEITQTRIRDIENKREFLDETRDSIMWMGSLFARIGKYLEINGHKVTSKLERWNNFDASSNQQDIDTIEVKKRVRK